MANSTHQALHRLRETPQFPLKAQHCYKSSRSPPPIICHHEQTASSAITTVSISRDLIQSSSRDHSPGCQLGEAAGATGWTGKGLAVRSHGTMLHFQLRNTWSLYEKWFDVSRCSPLSFPSESFWDFLLAPAGIVLLQLHFSITFFKGFITNLFQSSKPKP